jgi:hypothetical protein
MEMTAPASVKRLVQPESLIAPFRFDSCRWGAGEHRAYAVQIGRGRGAIVDGLPPRSGQHLNGSQSSGQSDRSSSVAASHAHCAGAVSHGLVASRAIFAAESDRRRVATDADSPGGDVPGISARGRRRYCAPSPYRYPMA